MVKYQHYMEMDTTFIYALNDPETGECRYVGKADDPHDRLFGKNGHLKKCHNLKHHCANWVSSLVARVAQKKRREIEKISRQLDFPNE